MAISELVHTKHSSKRCQQRGIKSEYLEMLVLYGKEYHCPGGGVKVMFDKASRQEVARECPDKQVLDKLFKLYYVECGDVMVTASHRRKRFH